MIGLFVVQLAGIFFAMELRAVINAGEYSGVDILSDLEYYNESPSTRSKWDALQREFKCCGGVNFNDGYKIWRNSDVGLTSNGVPDSCCLRPDPGCGRNIFAEQDSALNRLIHTHGCLTILSDKLLEQVVPVLVGYAGVGVVLALIQLLAVVFACSFSAQISREMYQDDARSLGRTSTYHGGVDHIIHHHQQHTLSMQGTPKAERVLGYSGVQHDDMNNKVFVADAEDRYSRKFMDSPTSELDERPV